METTTITLDPVLVSVIAGTIIPLATGIITKLKSASGVKATVALVLSAIVGVVNELVVQSGGTFDVRQAVLLAGTTFVANVAAYNGMWKPIGDTPYLPLQVKTANFGFGKVSDVGGDGSDVEAL
jgi:hypothetical protein